MAENYDIPIKSVYKYGPYMHSVEQNYMDAYLPSIKDLGDEAIQSQLTELESKIDIMESQERSFYDTFGVKDSIEFSQLYLLNKNTPLSDKATITQKLLSVLNSKEVFAILTDDKDTLPKLEKIAERFLLTDQNFIKNYDTLGDLYALEALKKQFNDMKKGKIKIKFNGKSISMDAPQKKISSNMSRYIQTLLEKFDPIVMQEVRQDYESRINRVMKYMDNHSQIFGDEYEFYREEIYQHLLGAAGKPDNKYLNKKNLSLFGNWASAEGGIFEIILTTALTPSKEYSSALMKQNRMLANETADVVRRRYSFDGGTGQASIVKTKQGTDWIIHYKSPTDLVLQSESGEYFTLQLKNTWQDISEISSLKLQGSIQLPTFLAKVSDVIKNENAIDLLIYHVVNQSTFPDSNLQGMTYVTKILSAAVEYYVESRYTRDLNQKLDDYNVVNAGNMFMIYSGYLIPISAFVKFAIREIKEDRSLFVDDIKSVLEYKTTYLVEQIRGKSFEERIQMGTQVYENTKITELKVAIGKILDFIGYFPKPG